MNIIDKEAPSHAALEDELRARIRGKAKPVGSLGRIEELALQIGLVSGSLQPDLGRAKILVFASDHGLTAEGVTAYPSAVTREIAKMVLAGNAGINVLARASGIDIVLVDAGMLEPLPAHDLLIDRRVASGTKNSRLEPAMTPDEYAQVLEAGRAIATQLVEDSVGIVGYGEIGIGNTSAAALVAHVLTGIDLATLVGPGAGAPALGLEHKRKVLESVLARANIQAGDVRQRAREALRQFGGFEIAMMASAMTAAAAARRIIVVDGFISTVAAVAAIALHPETRDCCVFAHCSAEPGHKALLNHLGARPLLELDMRLGEGTGAALAIPLVRAAELMLRDMADLPGEHPT
jgi:nicotinate-nucleotide--dimethylbenzimidazole phosphoribosyltransferase